MSHPYVRRLDMLQFFLVFLLFTGVDDSNRCF